MALFALAAAPVGGRQAAYDAAQAAYDKGDWVAAAAGFAPLLPSDPSRRLRPFEAVIAVRLAVALERTGRFTEAVAMARRGIPEVADTDPATLSDGWAVIGEEAHFALDFATSADAYAKAVRYATASGYDVQRVSATLGYGATLATVDPARAAVPVDALLADQTLVARLSKTTLAAVQEVRARIALNAGDLPDAQRAIDRALAASGGLGIKVSQLQLAIRGDAAIIAQRRGEADLARKYLAYTGAGHLVSVDWTSQFTGDLPVCGGEGDLRPDDSAVVQFSIDPDGHVTSAMPIFASRPGEVGAVFARAARSWEWRSTAIAKVEPFWRTGLRLEMRCDTRPDPQSLGKPVFEAANAWLDAHAADPLDDKGGHGDVAAPASDEPRSIPALIYATGGPRPKPADTLRLARLLDATAAPASLRAVVIIVHARNQPGAAFRDNARRGAEAIAAAEPEFAARYPDSLELAWLRLEWATSLERTGDFRAALPLLAKVLATPATILEPDAPIRQVATLHLALARARTGDADAAQAGLKAAGLNAEQCSLVDTRPVPTNLSVVSSQFPLQALAWNFEGFARVTYDIGADGRVFGIRTVLAYPPFVFGPGTEAAARNFRYAAPTIDGKVVGCQGETQMVNYRIPGK